MTPNEDIRIGSVDSSQSGAFTFDTVRQYTSSLVHSRATQAAAVAAVIMGTSASENAIASEMPAPEFSAPDIFELPPKPENGTRTRLSEYTDPETGELRIVYRDQDFDAGTSVYLISDLGELNIPEGYSSRHMSILPDGKVRFKDFASGDVVVGTLSGTEIVDITPIHTVESQLDTIEELTGEDDAFTYYAAGVGSDGEIREVFAYNEAGDSYDVDFTGSYVLDDDHENVEPSVSGDYTTYRRMDTNEVVVANGSNQHVIPGAGQAPFLNVEAGTLTSLDPESGNILVQHVVPEGPQLVGQATIEGLGTAFDVGTGLTNTVEAGNVKLVLPFADNLGGVVPDVFQLKEKDSITGEYTVVMPAAIDIAVEVIDGVSYISFSFVVPDDEDCRLIGKVSDKQNNSTPVEYGFNTETVPEAPTEVFLSADGESYLDLPDDGGRISVDGDLTANTFLTNETVSIRLEGSEDETELAGVFSLEDVKTLWTTEIAMDTGEVIFDMDTPGDVEITLTYGLTDIDGYTARQYPSNQIAAVLKNGATGRAIFPNGTVIHVDENTPLYANSDAEIVDQSEIPTKENGNKRKTPVEPSSCSTSGGNAAGFIPFLIAAGLMRKRK